MTQLLKIRPKEGNLKYFVWVEEDSIVIIGYGI